MENLEEGYMDALVNDYPTSRYTNVCKMLRQSTVSLQCAADIILEAIRWLWIGWLAKGKLHILAGAAGDGKTTIAMVLASIVSKGDYFPDGSKSPQGSVVIWSGEDSAADTLVPRLMAGGANLNKIHFIGDVTMSNKKRSFDPAIDMQELVNAASKIDDLSLLIIDPIVNAVSGDSHKSVEVRRALQPVVDFAEKLDCAVLGISHFSKGTNGREPLERVTGSLAFGALARIVLATAKITDGEKTRRIFCRAKSNIGVDNGGFEYELQQKEVKAGILSSAVRWGVVVEGSARELLSEPDNREASENGNSALEDAKEFLCTLLAENNNEMAQKDIDIESKGAGHSTATIRRAKIALNIKSSKSKLDGRWYWKLPESLLKNNEDAQDDQINSMSMLNTLDTNKE